MSVVSIVGGQILTGGGLDRGVVVVDDDAVRSVNTGAASGPPDPATDTIDATGLIVAPGFIDVQINGGFGIDLAVAPDRVWELGALLTRVGVTAFLPTIISSTADVRDGVIDALHSRPNSYAGAEPLGAHFEGPMLEPLRRGIHPADMLVAPDSKVIEGWSRDDGVRLVTIAPELPGAIEVIRELVRRGVIVALGHTNATSSEIRAALEAGASMVTHLFNAMRPFGHRDPGPVGVALAEQALVAGLIVDGLHVDPTVVAATWNAKGPDGIMLVSDAVAAMGQPPGRYHVGGVAVDVADGAVRDARGTFAGSILTIERAVQNLVTYTACRPEEALTSASTTPARAIGASDRGVIESGATGDIVLLDERLEVQLTLCAGRIVHVADAARHRIPPQLLEDGSSWK